MAMYVIVQRITGQTVATVHDQDKANSIARAWSKAQDVGHLDVYRQFERGPREGARIPIQSWHLTIAHPIEGA